MNPEHEKESTIRIVRAHVDDAPMLSHIRHKTWLATYVNEHGGITQDDVESKKFESAERIQKWKEFIMTEDGLTVLVAREGATVIGYCLVKEENGKQYIGALYVLPEAQGRGVGKKLMDHALSVIDDKKPIELSVVSFNNHAITFYESFGFEQRGINQDPHTQQFPSGRRMEEILMVREPKIYVQ